MILVPYTISNYNQVLKIFESNIPDFFHPSEKKEFSDFLMATTIEFYILINNDQIIGAGGIGLNSDETVSLCWGMIHKSHHNNKYGKFLLQERIRLIQKKFPGKKIVSNTSQITEGFFRKFGFNTVQSEDNYWAPGIHLRKMIL